MTLTQCHISKIKVTVHTAKNSGPGYNVSWIGIILQTLDQWYEPRDVRVKVKSSKGNPGSTDLISDRLCDMV